MITFCSVLLMVSAGRAVPFGDGVAQYTAPVLPDEPAVYTQLYRPETDDAAGIQAAIDAANAAGGGTVQLDAQTYLIDTPITMKSNVRLLGEGMGATVLKRDESFTTSDKYFVGATDGAISNVVVQALTLDRDFTEQEVLDNDETVLLGIRIYSSTEYYNRRIRVSEVEAIGFTVGVLMSGTEHIIIENCNMHHNGGTHLHHNVYFRRIGVVRFSGNYIHDSIGGSGLKLAGGTSSIPSESLYFTIVDNKICDNERINLNIQGCNYLLIEGNLLNGQKSTTAAMAGLFLRDYSGFQNQYTDVINNVLTNNVENGFYVEGSSDFSIQGNACFNNGTDHNFTSDNASYSCDYNSSAPHLSLETWRFDHFGSLFNAGDGADDNDPDADGRSNLTEYGTGTDPTVYNAGSAVTAGLTNDVFSIAFDRIEDPILIYEVEGSSDLSTNTVWSTIWTSTGASNTAGAVSVEDADGAVSRDTRFLRLNLSYE
jgi:parallel beta-helix repeat protein